MDTKRNRILLIVLGNVLLVTGIMQSDITVRLSLLGAAIFLFILF